MTIGRPLTAAALAAAAAIAVAGCGGGGSDQPSAARARAAYAPIRAEIRALGTAIGTEIGNASRETDTQLAAAFDRLTARGRADVARLQALDVPSDLDAKRQALHDALRSGTQALADIAAAASASDAAAAGRAVRQLIADSQTIRDARASFESALAAAR